MSVQGFALLVWDPTVEEWSSLCCGVDRERFEGLAERFREVVKLPARVVECDLIEDGLIVLGDPEVGSPVVADVLGVDDEHDADDPNA